MSKEELGIDELETLKGMWKRWLQRDVMWAAEVVVAQGGQLEDGEWEFLEEEWKENFYTWMYPYLKRLFETEHITEEQGGEFVSFAYIMMQLSIDAICKLEVTNE
jgi:hypothetical protein